jgi:H+/Cl- antiporter ClcA
MVKNKTILITSNIITAIITSLLCFLILKYVSPNGDEFSDYLSDGGSFLPFILISLFVSLFASFIISVFFLLISKKI